MIRLALAAMLFALASCGGGGSSPPPPPPAVTIPDMGAFLAPSICADGSFAVLSGCAGAARRAADPMRWRMADRSGHTDGQMSDAFVSDDGRWYAQTYSYPPHGPFVAAHGD